MIKSCFILGAILCVCLSAQTVRCEDQQKSWWVSPSAGFSFFESERGIKDNPVFGIGAGTKINEHWNFEGTLSYLGTETTGTPRSDLEIYQLAISLLYDIHPSKQLTPYLLAGGGGFHADSDKFGSKTGGILHYGAGLHYSLNQNLSIKGEVRHQIYIGIIDDDGKTKTRQNLTTLVGLNLHLDQTHHPVAAALPAPLIRMTPPATIQPTKDTTPAENIPLQEKISDDDLAKVDAGDSLEKQPAGHGTKPILTITPRFNAGEPDIHSWAPQDLTKLKYLIEDQPQAKIILMGEIDENTLSFSKYKLQERRAQRVRIFLIDHFNIDPQQIEIMTLKSWSRTTKKATSPHTLIQFYPIESETTATTQAPRMP